MLTLINSKKIAMQIVGRSCDMYFKIGDRLNIPN